MGEVIKFPKIWHGPNGKRKLQKIREADAIAAQILNSCFFGKSVGRLIAKGEENK